MLNLDSLHSQIQNLSPVTLRGRVTEVLGPVIRARMSGIAVGDFVTIQKRQSVPRKVSSHVSSPDSSPAPLFAQVVGFSQGLSILTPLGITNDILPGAEVTYAGQSPTVTAGDHLLGCVCDSLGRILERSVTTGRTTNPMPSMVVEKLPLHRTPTPSLNRKVISTPFVTGVRAIDSFLTLGQGQRISLFAEPGVGKSTLISTITRGSNADINVIALIGERGREVREFLSDALDEQSRKKTVVVVSTSDEPAICRATAALTATCLAEYFRDRGLNVLLQVDSLTRLLRAYREVGLAAGELPVRRGYPPSVYTQLPTLIERAGNGEVGSITAIYTVLLSSDLDEDPMVEEIKGLTDGHITLRHELAERGHFPAIDVLTSISRLQTRLVDGEFVSATRTLKRMLSRIKADRDLILLGNGKLDSEMALAIDIEPRINEFLRQDLNEFSNFDETTERLLRLAARCHQ